MLVLLLSVALQGTLLYSMAVLYAGTTRYYTILYCILYVVPPGTTASVVAWAYLCHLQRNEHKLVALPVPLQRAKNPVMCNKKQKHNRVTDGPMVLQKEVERYQKHGERTSEAGHTHMRVCVCVCYPAEQLHPYEEVRFISLSGSAASTRKR